MLRVWWFLQGVREGRHQAYDGPMAVLSEQGELQGGPFLVAWCISRYCYQILCRTVWFPLWHNSAFDWPCCPTFLSHHPFVELPPLPPFFLHTEASSLRLTLETGLDYGMGLFKQPSDSSRICWAPTSL